MALSVVLRHSVGSTGNLPSRDVLAFPPAPGSRILVFAWSQGPNAASTQLSISSNTGLTWSLLGQAGPEGAFFGRGFLWEAPVGASPSSTTITLTAGGGNNADITYVVVEVRSTVGTPPVVVQSNVHSYNNGTSLTYGPLPAAAVTGNMVIGFAGQNEDQSGFSIGGPAGFTNLTSVASTSTNYETVRADYSTSFAAASIAYTGSSSGQESANAFVELADPVLTGATRISYNTHSAASNFNTITTPKSTNAFDVVAGDLIVVMSSLESAASPTVVTPTASGGSVTWTARATQNANTTQQSAAYCWTGLVGATASGITVSLDRPSSSTSLFWGMSATVWRGHGGVGVVFSGNNGISNGAPSVSATCAANSAVQCQINDWNAVDGATRTWRTINGVAQSEATYVNVSGRHTVYGGYTTDTGAAGSITQGLTAPSTMRWVLVGVEITSPVVADGYMLMENGDRILFENSDLMVAENFIASQARVQRIQVVNPAHSHSYTF